MRSAFSVVTFQKNSHLVKMGNCNLFPKSTPIFHDWVFCGRLFGIFAVVPAFSWYSFTNLNPVCQCSWYDSCFRGWLYLYLFWESTPLHSDMICSRRHFTSQGLHSWSTFYLIYTGSVVLRLRDTPFTTVRKFGKPVPTGLSP